MNNTVAVLTGGTGGLGKAIAHRLAARDCKLAISYIIPEEATELENELDLPEDRLMLRRVDATDSEAMTAFMKHVVDEFGHINVLGCLVGGWLGGRDIEETDDVRFERMLDLNLRSSFYAARAVVPHLREAEWGRIVMVGSRAAIDPVPGQGMYNIAKAAVITLARTLAQELGDSNVTSNVLIPSVIDTPAFREAIPFADYVNWPTPSQIAAVVDFLASPDSSVVNGAMIPVYGNM